MHNQPDVSSIHPYNIWPTIKLIIKKCRSRFKDSGVMCTMRMTMNKYYRNSLRRHTHWWVVLASLFHINAQGSIPPHVGSIIPVPVSQHWKKNSLHLLHYHIYLLTISYCNCRKCGRSIQTFRSEEWDSITHRRWVTSVLPTSTISTTSQPARKPPLPTSSLSIC